MLAPSYQPSAALSSIAARAYSVLPLDDEVVDKGAEEASCEGERLDAGEGLDVDEAWRGQREHLYGRGRVVVSSGGRG